MALVSLTSRLLGGVGDEQECCQKSTTPARSREVRLTEASAVTESSRELSFYYPEIKVVKVMLVKRYTVGGLAMNGHNEASFIS